MVRVISVHNFLKQDISSVEELIDVVVVPPDILLLVQSDHSILVRDLSLPNDAGYNIPTVDQVVKIKYSLKGNYIGTLEKKQTRNGNDVFYIRIYLNWENLWKFKDLPPMRARIAGRVTPLSQNHEGLEMIEIPAQDMPDNMACCPISGNLIISSKNSLAIYKLKIQIHDISKIYFIDFEQLPVKFLLSFVPTRMQLIENMIAAQNDEFTHVFKIALNSPKLIGDETKCRELSSDEQENPQASPLRFSQRSEAINYEALLKSKDGIKVLPLTDSPAKSFGPGGNGLDSSSANRDAQSELTKISACSFPVRHDFPTVAAYRSSESKSGDVHKQNPFLASQDLVVNMLAVGGIESTKMPYIVEDIVQYQLMPLVLGSCTNREMQEKFTCLILKPYYSSESEVGMTARKRETPPLASEHHGRLRNVACFFGTQQEGYLHRFDCETGAAGAAENVPGSYVVYPFTAPVTDVELEESFLHAVTDTGLETYTMRAAWYPVNSDRAVSPHSPQACPSVDDPICLIGLRPFVNVFRLFLTHHYLVLFANNEETSRGTWTLYKLNLPGLASVWNDFLAVAEENRWEAPATYCQMIGEGHLILKTYLKCCRWISQTGGSENRPPSPAPFLDREEASVAERLFKESCALLGDFHMGNEEFEKASDYYKMSECRMWEIVRRREEEAASSPSKASEGGVAHRGLLYLLRRRLASYDEDFLAFAGNREEFYTPEIGSTVNLLLDCLEKDRSLSVSDLVLESVVLREFSTDRILKMMKDSLSRSSPPHEKDALSLSLMCIQRDQTEQAKTVLRTLSPQRLEDLLHGHHRLLFEQQRHPTTTRRSFSELATVLMETFPAVLGSVLSRLVAERRLLGLAALLETFLDILPSGTVRSKNSSLVLRIVLEDYFACLFENFPSRKCDFKSTEALKILIRIYLTILNKRPQPGNDAVQSQGSGISDKVLFEGSRRPYLRALPPFAPEWSGLLAGNGDGPEVEDDAGDELRLVLLKIQSLLSHEGIPPECIAEVRNYLQNQANVFGALSLQVLSAANVQEGIRLLIAFAPHALLPYMKDRVKEVEDWRYAAKQLRLCVASSEEGSVRSLFYGQLLTDVLLHAARTFDIEQLVEVLPRDLDDGDGFLLMAQNHAQANHIRTLIVTTGKQLKTTLYETSSARKTGHVHT